MKEAIVTIVDNETVGGKVVTFTRVFRIEFEGDFITENDDEELEINTNKGLVVAIEQLIA